MSIAVNVNDPTNSGVSGAKSSTGSSSLTGSSTFRSASSFFDAAGGTAEETRSHQPHAEQRTDHAACRISTVSGIEKLKFEPSALFRANYNNQSLG